MGGAIGGFMGSLTGGLIGKDPRKEARKEAERQREAERRRIEEAERREKEEKRMAKKMGQDAETLNQNLMQQEGGRAIPRTNVDFSGSVKKSKDEEEEDVLKKALKVGK